jgi:hypothetical protein
MPIIPKQRIINWPDDYPAAVQAARDREQRREARRVKGHFNAVWLPKMRHARNVRKGDRPGLPTGKEIVHTLSSRHERRRSKHERK